MNRVKIAAELVKLAKELVSYTPEEGEALTADMVKALQKKKRELGIKSMKQNYKGTGRKKADRQIWMRFKNGAVLDIWFYPSQISYGGVVWIDPSGNRTLPNPRVRKVTGNARQVADMIAEDIQAWFDAAD